MTCHWTEFLSGGWGTQNCNAGQLDVLVQPYVAEAVDQVDQFAQVVEERLVRLLNFLHL
jgi:hypothetical protein